MGEGCAWLTGVSSCIMSGKSGKQRHHNSPNTQQDTKYKSQATKNHHQASIANIPQIIHGLVFGVD